MIIHPALASSVDAIQRLNPLFVSDGAAQPTAESSHSDFNGLFKEAINNLQRLDEDASSKVKGLLSGDGTDIHTVMIATQQASLAFEAALAVRNKVVSAYQQVMGMQF